MGLIKNAVSNARQYATKRPQKNPSTTATNSPSSGPSQATNNKSSQKLTKANEAFVKSYGFGDLPNNQVRRYRDMSSAIMRRVKKMDSHDERISMTSEVKDLIKRAGSHPKHRGTLRTLYATLAKDNASLSTSQLKKLNGLLKRTGDLSSSKAGRAAALTLVKDPSFSKDKMVYALAPALISRVAKTSKNPKAAASTIKTMAHYVATNSRSNAQLKLYGGYVKQNHPTAKIGGPDLKGAMDRIATSKNPRRTARSLAKGLQKSLATAKKKTRATEQEHAARILNVDMGLNKKLASKMAKRIFDLGGPNTPAAAHLVSAALNKSGTPLSKKKHGARMNKILTSMQEKSMAGHARSFQLKHRALAPPSGKAHSAQSWAKTLATYMDAAQIGGQILDTSVTMLALEETAVGTLSSAASTVLAVGGGVLALNEIGGAQRKFIEEEGAQYSKKGHLAAMHIARGYSIKPGMRMPNMKRAYSEARQSRYTPRYALRPESFKAYKMAFEDTFRHLSRMTYKERKNYFKAYDWAKKHIK